MSRGYYYVETEPGTFTVGHDDPTSLAWMADSDHATIAEAADRVAYLNGGGKQLIEAIERLADLLDRAGQPCPVRDTTVYCGVHRFRRPPEAARRVHDATPIPVV